MCACMYVLCEFVCVKEKKREGESVSKAERERERRKTERMKRAV